MIPIVAPAGAVNNIFESDLSPAPLYVKSTLSKTTSAPWKSFSGALTGAFSVSLSAFFRLFPVSPVLAISASPRPSSISPVSALSISLSESPSFTALSVSLSVIDGFISNTLWIRFPHATAFVETTIVFASFISSTRICDI